MMLIIQDLPRLGNVEGVFGALAPGDRQQPVQIRPSGVVVRRRRVEGADLLKLFLDDFRGGGRRVQLRELVIHSLRELRLLVHLHPKLLLDDLELLCQEVLPLDRADVLFHLLVDRPLHLRLFELDLEEAQRLREAILHVQRLQYRLEGRAISRGHRRADIRQMRRVLHVHLREDRLELLLEKVLQLHNLLHRGENLAHVSFDDLV
mmetsp:Transcript_7499/g.18087  ORF Transcript_7499/g.18087 Transcript_7499/m.18087 type:complete len:206 (-) Transcript_7499:469-1086(-)